MWIALFVKFGALFSYERKSVSPEIAMKMRVVNFGRVRRGLRETADHGLLLTSGMYPNLG